MKCLCPSLTIQEYSKTKTRSYFSLISQRHPFEEISEIEPKIEHVCSNIRHDGYRLLREIQKKCPYFCYDVITTPGRRFLLSKPIDKFCFFFIFYILCGIFWEITLRDLLLGQQDHHQDLIHYFPQTCPFKIKVKETLEANFHAGNVAKKVGTLFT